MSGATYDSNSRASTLRLSSSTLIRSGSGTDRRAAAGSRYRGSKRGDVGLDSSTKTLRPLARQPRDRATEVLQRPPRPRRIERQPPAERIALAVYAESAPRWMLSPGEFAHEIDFPLCTEYNRIHIIVERHRHSIPECRAAAGPAMPGLDVRQRRTTGVGCKQRRTRRLRVRIDDEPDSCPVLLDMRVADEESRLSAPAPRCDCLQMILLRHRREAPIGHRVRPCRERRIGKSPGNPSPFQPYAEKRACGEHPEQRGKRSLPDGAKSNGLFDQAAGRIGGDRGNEDRRCRLHAGQRSADDYPSE